MPILNKKAAYREVAEEIDTEDYDPATLAEAVEKADGDYTEARAFYVKLRTRELAGRMTRQQIGNAMRYLFWAIIAVLLLLPLAVGDTSEAILFPGAGGAVVILCMVFEAVYQGYRRLVTGQALARHD